MPFERAEQVFLRAVGRLGDALRGAQRRREPFGETPGGRRGGGWPEPFFGVAIILEGMLQGTGNTMAPFVFNIIGMWGVRILGTFVCTRLLHMGLVAAWACMIAHNLLLFLLLLTYCLRGRWNPLTRG